MIHRFSIWWWRPRELTTARLRVLAHRAAAHLVGREQGVLVGAERRAGQRRRSASAAHHHRGVVQRDHLGRPGGQQQARHVAQRVDGRLAQRRGQRVGQLDPAARRYRHRAARIVVLAVDQQGDGRLARRAGARRCSRWRSPKPGKAIAASIGWIGARLEEVADAVAALGEVVAGHRLRRAVEALDPVRGRCPPSARSGAGRSACRPGRCPIRSRLRSSSAGVLIAPPASTHPAPRAHGHDAGRRGRSGRLVQHLGVPPR